MSLKHAIAALAASIFAICLVMAPEASVTHAQVATTPDGGAASSSSLQNQLSSDDQQIATLNQQIAQYQAQLQQIGSDKKTLQAAINALDLQRNKVQAQVLLTQKQIDSTQVQIQQLGGEITNTQQTITTDQTSLGVYLRNLQKTDGQPMITQVLSSGGITQAWDDVNANLQIENSIQNTVQTLQAQKNNLASSRTASEQKQQTLTTQQQTLASQQQSLAATVQSKNQLLAQTNAQESTYEKLLAAAEAELNSFSAFTQNAGGSKLLAGQTNCDAWGCYYSQRDALWGNEKLNGTQYTMASDGCLVTSMAMVLTHYGYHDVTPATINADPSNFASYYPAYLLTSINVDGVTATRKTATIDATLATGNPVIVGIHAYGGTHFVVLVSGSKGRYIMRDPYIASGKDINFTNSYSLKSIFAITKVVIG